MGPRAPRRGGPGLGVDGGGHRTGSAAPPGRGLRADFPILAREFEGKQLVYLDNAATAQKPESVIEAIASYYRRSNANVHRSMHQLAEEAERLYEGGRAKVAGLIGAAARELIFVRNATEAINLVRYSWGRANVGEGDSSFTQMEHHSNVVPWQRSAQSRAAARVPARRRPRRLDLSELDELLAGGRVQAARRPPTSRTCSGRSTRSKRSRTRARRRGAGLWTGPRRAADAG